MLRPACHRSDRYRSMGGAFFLRYPGRLWRCQRTSLVRRRQV